MNRARGLMLLAASLALLALPACAGRLRTKELESIAKDWSVTIRASQVIPVYPLTEDLQPGDVFLVTRPIQRQAEQYKDKGFLALDQQMARLRPLDFPGYYRGSFGVGGFPPDPNGTEPGSVAPDMWRFPDGWVDWTENGTERKRGNTAWTRAPRAYFPTYTFKVASGQGASLALPLNAVPTGLSLMGTDSATGNVALKDAFSYGVSLSELMAPVEAWAGKGEVRRMLKDQRANAREVYVRVLSRVFLVGGVAVSLTNDRAFGLGGSAGSAPADQRATLTEGQVKDNLESIRKASSAQPSATPGGSVRFELATSRAVSAFETFDRPLAIGYLSFDFPVDDDGRLGPPVTTLDQLERRTARRESIGTFSPAEQEYGFLSGVVRRLEDDVRAVVVEAAARDLGKDFLAAYQAEKAGTELDPWDAFDSARLRLNPPVLKLNEALRRALETK
ncbi:MAG TPA: hypothetical protein VJV23_00345 [Candidatus Polarisedimenticolia bacterium]|nr:hypothetical protein [Candidatus Polarisedimenticolia bacterium]